MKKLQLIIATMSLFQLMAVKLNAQTVSNFENLTLPADSFFNGSSQQGGTSFISGNAIFLIFRPIISILAFGGPTAMLKTAAPQASETYMLVHHLQVITAPAFTLLVSKGQL